MCINVCTYDVCVYYVLGLYVVSPVHNIDNDAQLSITIKDTALTQATSFDVDTDADAGIQFISIPGSVSTSISASASYYKPGCSLKPVS